MENARGKGNQTMALKQPQWIRNQNIQNKLTEIKTRLDEKYDLPPGQQDFIPVVERLEFILRNILQILEYMHINQTENSPKDAA